jgi:hypothetical protein
MSAPIEGRSGCSVALQPQQRRWPDIEPGHLDIQIRAIGSCLFLFVLAALLAGALPLLILVLVLLLLLTLTLVVPLLLAHVSSPLTASALMLRTRLAKPELRVR